MFHLWYIKMSLPNITLAYTEDNQLGDNRGYWMSPCNVAQENDMDNPEETKFKDFFVTSQFLTGLVLYPIICILGIIGNILSIIVFTHRKITSTSVFLIALALADLLKIINDVLYIIVSVLFRRAPLVANRMLGTMYPFAHYVFNQSVCVCSWITVCIGVERYFLVCHIALAKQICTPTRARNISLAVFLVMSLISLPTAFRYTRVKLNLRLHGQNITQYHIMLTRFGCSPAFATAYMWIMNLLRSLIPLAILIVINSLIIYAVGKQSAGRVVSASRHRITFMLIIVILVFVLCLTPDAIMSTIFGFGYVEAGYLVKGIREYSDTLILLNSAVNFLIYCVCNSCFRETFKNLFWDKISGIVSPEAHNGSQRSLMSLRASCHDYREDNGYHQRCKELKKMEEMGLKNHVNGSCIEVDDEVGQTHVWFLFRCNTCKSACLQNIRCFRDDPWPDLHVVWAPYAPPPHPSILINKCIPLSDVQIIFQ